MAWRVESGVVSGMGIATSVPRLAARFYPA